MQKLKSISNYFLMPLLKGKKSDKPMETNTIFSFQRLLLLFKQSLIINKKMIGITVAGFAGLLFIVLIIMQSAANFNNWSNQDSMATLIFIFFQMGILYAGYSFPVFRTKEKSMTYLMLPVNASEKFVFELLSRIVLFVVLMPFIYWVVANLEGVVVNYFKPELVNYKFSFSEGWSMLMNHEKFDAIAKYSMFQGMLLVFLVVFAGASTFSKSPLLKTLFTLSVIFAAFGLYSFLLVKGFDIENYHPAHNRVLFVNNERDGLTVLAIGVTLINLCLLAIAWFRLKEKEA